MAQEINFGKLTIPIIKGDKGDKGDQGIQGIQGEKGDTGANNTLTIGTVVQGERASASITGESPNQVLNLILPKGDKGEKGDTGEQGQQGIQGIQGEKGDKGDKGDTGEQGETGATGDTGNGIASVEKTSTSGLVDTYTITYTDGTTTTFEVTNGEDGEVSEEEFTALENKVKSQQKILDQMPKVSGEGTQFTMNNTIEAEFAEYAVEGRSEQETTNGYQLLQLKVSQDDKTTNNINQRLYVDTGKVVLNGTPSTTFNLLLAEITLPADTYSISGCPSGGSWNDSYGLLLVSGLTVFSDYGSGRTFTIEQETSFQVMMRVSSSYTFNNFTFYPLIEPGSTIHSYEKYTGGIASPNVDYPSERYSAGANGSITEKITNSDNTKTQTYTIPVQQEMRDIKDSNGNVIAKDEFIEKDGVKYERHNIARRVFDGTETFVLELSNEKIKQFRTPQNFLPNLLITPDPFAQLGNSASNYFIKLSNANALTDKGFTLNGNKQVIFNTEFTTVAELKAWLAEQYANGTPVYVDYIVSEPTDLPCTQEQIDVLENLPETYPEQTNVLSEDSVPANVKASGYLDLNSLVTRVAQLETEV